MTRRRKQQIHPEPQGPCPACGKEAAYVLDHDRYFHTDGSDNQPCWLRIVRGDAPFRHPDHHEGLV